MPTLLTGAERDFVRMKMALERAFEDTGYCYVCEQHAHATDCPLYEPDDFEDDEESA